MLGSLPRSNLLLAILPCVVCSKVKDLEVVLQTHAEEATCPLAAFSTSKWRRLCHGRRRRQRSPLSRQSRRPAIARARSPPHACRPPCSYCHRSSGSQQGKESKTAPGLLCLAVGEYPNDRGHVTQGLPPPCSQHSEQCSQPVNEDSILF